MRRGAEPRGAERLLCYSAGVMVLSEEHPRIDRDLIAAAAEGSQDDARGRDAATPSEPEPSFSPWLPEPKAELPYDKLHCELTPTLARRLAFDLTGIAPAREEVAAFDAAAQGVVFNFLSDRPHPRWKEKDLRPARRFDTVGNRLNAIAGGNVAGNGSLRRTALHHRPHRDERWRRPRLWRHLQPV